MAPNQGGEGLVYGEASEDKEEFPVAVLPCATRKQAQQLCRFHNLSREQKVEAIAREMQSSALDGGIWDECHDLRKTRYRERAIAILNLIEGNK